MQGENSQQAAEREVAEELGLGIDLSDRRPDFTINFVHGFDDYYLLEQEVDLASLRLQEEEVRLSGGQARRKCLRCRNRGQ